MLEHRPPSLRYSVAGDWEKDTLDRLGRKVRMMVILVMLVLLLRLLLILLPLQTNTAEVHCRGVLGGG